MVVTSPSELAPDQTAELRFSHKEKQAPSIDRIGPEESELHYTTRRMVISYYTNCIITHHFSTVSYVHIHMSLLNVCIISCFVTFLNVLSVVRLFIVSVMFSFSEMLFV